MNEGTEPHAGFLAAMRQLAATVTIVTTAGPDGPAGMTATAVTSLSLEPPALLVCVNREASVHPALAMGRAFCVNVLALEHAALAASFGGGTVPERRFAQGEWRQEAGVPPHLAGAAALVFCIVDLLLDYGTHTIVVGRVTRATADAGAQPLLYSKGRYVHLAGTD